MSYILEALKKSERERIKGQVPDLQSVHVGAALRRRRFEMSNIVLLIVVCCNALFVSIWLYQEYFSQGVGEIGELSAYRAEAMLDTGGDRDSKRSSDLAVQEVDSFAHNITDSKNNFSEAFDVYEQAEALLIEDRLRKLKEMQESKTSEIKSKVSLRSSRDRVSLTEIIDGEHGESVETDFEPSNYKKNTVVQSQQKDEILISPRETLIMPSTTRSKVDSLKKQMALAKLPFKQELSSSILNQLPRLSFNSHMYSEDARFRSVIVNGAYRREGDNLAQGLILEHITENGVVLNYNDIKFRVAVLQNWSD